LEIIAASRGNEVEDDIKVLTLDLEHVDSMREVARAAITTFGKALARHVLSFLIVYATARKIPLMHTTTPESRKIGTPFHVPSPVFSAHV